MGLTSLGNWPTLIGVALAGAAWLFYRRKRREALLLLVASLSGRLLVILEKAYFARERPDEHLRLVEVHYQSFPSGHSANSMIVYVGMALLAFDREPGRRRAVSMAILLAFLIGLSRPMLGVHWPSDVVAGWAFGALWLTAVLTVGERWIQPVQVQTLNRNSKTSPS